MTDEKVIKKDKVVYPKNAFVTYKGYLTLTNKRLTFSREKGLIKKTEELVFDVPLDEILSAKAEKGIGYGVDNFIVLYQEEAKEKKAKFQHASLQGFALGPASRIGTLYFGEWERIINDYKVRSAGLA